MARILSPPISDAIAVNKTERKTPRRYNVLMHNDNYTTMEFVIAVLQEIFHKENVEATTLMLQIHRRGYALCGLYPYEIAETKVDKVHQRARGAGYPLRCSLEPE